jgi:hypothetical protein
VRLLQQQPDGPAKVPPEQTSDDLTRTVQRVRALLER